MSRWIQDLLGKNAETVKAALLEFRSLGIPVIALVSDLDASVRTTYIGGDNRAAGQLAGFIFGRSLERESGVQVAIVACNLAYRCWEDRAIGFRSQRAVSGITSACTSRAKAAIG